MLIVIPEDYQLAVKNLACIKLLSSHNLMVLADTSLIQKEYHNILKQAEVLVLIRERTKITEEFLSICPALKLISQTGKVTGHIDISACSKRGIAIAEGIGSPVAPAELTWALIMTAIRQLPQAIEAVKKGKWQVNIGRTISGKTLGIWGYGKIGKLVASYARAFNANVLVWGSETSRNLALNDGFQKAENKEEFFESSDILTLHLKLTAETTGIVKELDLLRMKPDALFVNSSRAGLLEKNALLSALQKGRPGYAALDVFDEEPLSADNLLLKMDNVICSPHLGYVEKESYEMYFASAFQNILAFESGSPVNILNPEVLK